MRSRLLGAGTAALFALGLSGCPVDNTPTSYDQLVDGKMIVRDNFLETCVGRVPAIEGTTTTLASSSYCECAFDVFKKNVPYNDDDKKNRDGGTAFANYSGKTFTELNNDLRDDPNALSDDLKAKLHACPSAGERVGPAAPGSTVAPVGPVAPTSAGNAVPATAGPAGSSPA